MNVTITVDGDLGRLMAAHGNAVLLAANDAVTFTTEQVLLLQRQVVAGGLGSRAANLVGRRFFFNEKEGPGAIAGYTHSRWWRGARGGKTVGAGKVGANDVLAKHVTGGAIFPQRAGLKFLYIPLGTARTAGGSVGNRRGRLSFSSKGKRGGDTVSLIPLRNRRGFLVIDFGLSGRRNKGRGQPIALLVDRVYLRRRLNFQGVEERGQKIIQDQFEVSLARRTLH